MTTPAEDFETLTRDYVSAVEVRLSIIYVCPSIIYHMYVCPSIVCLLCVCPSSVFYIICASVHLFYSLYPSIYSQRQLFLLSNDALSAKVADSTPAEDVETLTRDYVSAFEARPSII